MADHGDRAFRIGVLLTLLVASFLMAAPAMQGHVLSYDDEALLKGSEDGPGALGRSPGSFFTSTYYYAYLPLYGLSYWVDGKLGATVEKPTLFHVQNVLWHAAASYVVFLLLGLLVGNRWAAFLGALLFAVHPLHVESVAWIASRKDVLSGFLCLAAWLVAVRAEERRILLLPALLLFLLACFAKASAIVLPALLLGAALLLPRYAGRRGAAALAALPFLVLAVVPLVVHLMVGAEAGVVSGQRPLGDRALGFVAGWGGALWRTALPIRLSIDYPEANAAGLAEVALPGLLLFLALLLLLLLRRRSPVAAFGIAAFFLALLPFNNVFPSTAVLAADRYLYLSVLGVSFLAAWAAARWTWGGLGGVGVALLCLGLSIASARRFRSDEELWTATIAARDGSALAYVNRGLARTGNGVRANPAGIADLQAGYARARLDEHRAKAAAGLVLPLLEAGRVADALERADDALRNATGNTGDARRFRATVLYNKGLVHGMGAGAHAAAARDFVASAELWPRYQSWYEAGRSCFRAGLADDARTALERAAAIDRSRPDPYLYLALLWKHAGDKERWKEALEEAERRAPDDPDVAGGWIDYWTDDRAPNYVKAEEQLKRVSDAATRRELSAQVEEQRALYRFRRGDLGEATRAADRARDEGLKDASDLGQIYLEAGRYDDAVACYRTVARGDAARRDAVGRALALKAGAALRAGDEAGAAAGMREALEEGPTRIEAGAAPLDGEIQELRATADPRLLALAAAAVAGDRDLALRLSDRVLADGPEGADRRLFYRLRALVRAHCADDLAGAEDDLRLLVGEDGTDLWARIRLAQVLTRRGLLDLRGAERTAGETRVDEAIEILSEALAEAPDSVAARIARGEARFARGDLTGAKADYLALRERGLGGKEVCLKEAILHRLVYVQGGETDNLDAAKELLGRALEEDPNDFEALFELGNVHHNLYDRTEDLPAKRQAAFNRAIFWYRRAMATNPRVPAPRVEWARLVTKAAREAIASTQLKTAHELLARVEAEAPDVIDAHKEHARLLLQPEFGGETGIGPDEFFEAAAHAIAEVKRLDPEDPELRQIDALYHRRRGWSFYLTWAKIENGPRRDRARELAVEEFKAAVSIAPEDPENARIPGLLREIAPEVVVLDAEAAKAAFAEGAKAYDEQRFGDAAAAFRRAALLFPESIELHWALAKALKRANRDDEAKDEFQFVANHAEADRHPEALYELGFLYLSRGEKLVGRPWLQRFVETMERLDRGDEPLVKIARERLAQLAGE
ncbi:MAG TPA: tetratricopeptide repeat protein [Planctomycetota bacterium]|nr:tetratricopeptide repeat protein [Planctomycetota bacterium]